MGGAVSSGRDNNELVDNLVGSKYIRSRDVELAFRALDRGDYMLPGERDRAYKDLAWRSGELHLSAPCIYSEVMEGLELRAGLSFLNVGSGTGYLSTLAGLVLGTAGVSHGVELHPAVLQYSNRKLQHFMENSPALDEFDFCEPKFYLGNGLCLAPQQPYDRVYCGAGCPDEYQNYFRQLIRVGGVLVLPVRDTLLQVRRVAHAEWRCRTLLSVSFAPLRPPAPAPAPPPPPVLLECQGPARLQALSRAAMRAGVRAALLARHPQLRPAPRAAPAPAPARSLPRRICIPIDDDSDVEGLNALHDLDRATGANEMNALLSLVLSMGQNRVAGALRFDPVDSSGDGSSADDDDDRDDGDDDGDDAQPAPAALDNLEDMNRAIHRAIDAAEPRELAARGRLSLTLEYSSSPPERAHPTEPMEAGGPDAADPERPSRPDTADPCQCEHPDEPNTDRRSPPPTIGHTGAGGSAVDVGGGAGGDAGAGSGKRQKLDSGLGGDHSPSSGLGDDQSPSSGFEQMPSLGCSPTQLADDIPLNGRRRVPKRTRCSRGSSSSSSSGSTEESSEGEGSGGSGGEDTRRRRRKRRAGEARARGARRAHLALLMRQAVRALPLPPALRDYVNLGRPFP